MNELESLRAYHLDRVKSWLKMESHEVLKRAPKIRARRLELNSPAIVIGTKEDLRPGDHEALYAALRTLGPWKKGPFSIFGIEIDAEWRSDLKWDRIQPHLPPLKGKRVADVGCNNGYFMFRTAGLGPEKVIGFEPFAQHWWTFEILQKYAQCPELVFEPFGLEHIHLYPQYFDVILCMGILYHSQNPMATLATLKKSMAPGASMIIECQGIEGDNEIALCPRNRYANARGIWFLPTKSCLENWIIRSGFRNVQHLGTYPLTPEEQRRTEWAPLDSLKEFLDPKDPKKTCEGYPAPVRIYFRAQL